ncbi:MAG TPA: carbohydrate-binding family 9-like protein [Polyangiaceae bacterium]|nr:carbohydrate-binding family 9-like protein [Polyangiaceae bacterium]
MKQELRIVRRPAAGALRATVACLTGAILFAGCVGGSKGLSSEDKERLKPFVLDAVPADIPHKLDTNFENKVHLIGYKFEPELARPGQDVKLTYYWRCDDTLEDGWLLFTHTKDEGSGKMGNLDFVGPIREERNGHQLLGPERWEKGKIYIDEQSYKVPGDVTGSEVSILTGVWKGDARLRIISGPNDGDNSAIVGKLKTGIEPKAADEHTLNEVPTLTVRKLADGAKITVDGKASEAEWGGAASTGPFVDVGTGKPNTSFPVNASAKLLWDDKNLYVLYEVQQTDFYTGFTDAKAQPADFTAAGQPKLWTHDTIEMMVDPDPSGDNKDYYELQINPQNKVFKSQFDTLQQPNGGPNGPFGHEDWDPKIKSAVQIQKGADGKPTGYTVEAAIPWAGYSKATKPAGTGEVWRVNFYAMHNNGGVSWSPILGQGTFHKATRFGRVSWGVPAAPAGSASGAAAPAAPGSGGPPTVTAAGDSGIKLIAMPRPGLGLHPTPKTPPSP